MRPPPEYEHVLPVPSGDVYDPFISLADVLGTDAAVARDGGDCIDLTGLDYEEQTLLKLRILAGSEHGDEPTVSHGPATWEGRITDITFGGCGARTAITYEWPGGSNTSAAKPVPNYGVPNGYGLSSVDLLVEFFDVDPVALADLDTPLPVPMKTPFDMSHPDYSALREELFEQAPWHGYPDEFIVHEPWRPDLMKDAAPHDDVYDLYNSGDWVSLNPKYRGRFTP